MDGTGRQELRHRKFVMVTWTYRCYVDGTDPNLWQDWYDDHEEVQPYHDQTFDMIEQMDQWGPPKVKKLKNHGKLFEVCLKGARIQWRIFGFYGAERHEFIVTHIGYHKNKGKYTPPNVLATAENRMKDIKDGKAETVECRRPGAPDQA